jgi:hypothetical protein
MRPSDDPELLGEIRDEYEDDPESAKAEYGAEFRTDLENIYSRAALEVVRCLAGSKHPTGRARYRAFVDPSGGSADSYVLAIGHDEERVYDGEKSHHSSARQLKEWVPKFDPEAVSKEVVEICKRLQDLAGHRRRVRRRVAAGSSEKAWDRVRPERRRPGRSCTWTSCRW